MPRSEGFLLKQTYPYRDHKLALKILRILNKKQDSTTNEIRDNLGVKAPYSQKKVRDTLGRLNEIGYCQEVEDITKRTKWITLEELNKSKHFKGSFHPNKLDNCWEKINGYTFQKKNSSNYILCRITIEGEKQFCVESRIRRWSVSFKGKLLILVFEKQSFGKFIKENSNNIIMNLAQILLRSNKTELVNMLLDRLRRSYDAGFNLEKTANEWYEDTIKSISKMSLDKEKHPELTNMKLEINERNKREKILKTKNY